ncbi:hypothetical protein EB796_005292 [Bugula neritina]|uniref:Uncharacterized protein n=1 Tax=Bugula neritina TaxID=10212 RepID=A0A7J7KDX2_BUGNE|nr:hypothetical protein EB796_005292 [Bugula neritina]
MTSQLTLLDRLQHAAAEGDTWKVYVWYLALNMSPAILCRICLLTILLTVFGRAYRVEELNSVTLILEVKLEDVSRVVVACRLL